MVQHKNQNTQPTQASQPSPFSEEANVRVTNTLTIKDIITIIGLIVTLAAGWSAFSARVTVLEQTSINLTQEVKELRQQISIETQQRMTLEQRVRDDEVIIKSIPTKK